RPIIRVALVLVRSDDRRVLTGREPLATKRFHDPLLDFEFASPAGMRTPPDLLKGGAGDRVNTVPCIEMRANLLIGPGRFKARHQVAGADYFFAEATHHLDRAGVHQARSEEHTSELQ